MINRVVAAITLLCSLVFATPALAGRTAIDQYPDGTRLTYYISGYCDFNGDDCGDSSGLFLPYSVSIGGAAFTNRVVVQGNGLLTFGGAIQFADNATVYDAIANGTDPQLTDYGLTLVSAGQYNALDFQSYNAFYQSADLRLVPNTNRIKADWFTCVSPAPEGGCPKSYLSSLTLTPTKKGFLGHFDFTSDGTDRGYVSGGVYTATGADFFLPATFEGLTFGVPEPASWAMMIVGFGVVGMASRRRANRLASAIV